MFRFEAQLIHKGGAMKVRGVLVDASIVWGKRFYILEFWGKIEKTYICYLGPVFFRNKILRTVVRKCKERVVRICKML